MTINPIEGKPDLYEYRGVILNIQTQYYPREAFERLESFYAEKIPGSVNLLSITLMDSKMA